MVVFLCEIIFVVYMRNDSKIVSLELKYKKIYDLCLINFFNSAREKDSDVYTAVLAKCDKLLKEAKQFIFNEINLQKKTSAVSRFTSTKLSQMFKDAYYFYKDDERQPLIFNGRASLLDWEEGKNPYRDLQKLDNGENNHDWLQDEDVANLFDCLIEILSQKQTCKQMKRHIIELLDKYRISL